MEALQSVLATAFSLLPAPAQRAATAVGGTVFEGVAAAVEAGLVPDAVIRRGIRALLRQRDSEAHVSAEARAARLQAFVDELASMPVAIEQEAANEQHYEVPTSYFTAVLGPHKKYSCCLYPPPPAGRDPLSAAQARADATDAALGAAEEAMLALSCERAGLADGQDVLELGCGWGSLCLFIAARYPASRVTAVSNSRTQRAYIEGVAAERGLKNITVLTRDAAKMGEWLPAASYDRVVSVECLEHLKNYGVALACLGAALRPGGSLFIHVFAHDSMGYHFVPAGPTDWMARHFFSGGTMPAFHLLPRFAGGESGLTLARQWAVSGTQYARTLEAWLVRHDAKKGEVMAAMEEAYGPGAPARTWNVRWRLFYLACSELFAYKGGDTWYVAHYRFDKGKAASAGGGAAGVAAAAAAAGKGEL